MRSISFFTAFMLFSGSFFSQVMWQFNKDAVIAWSYEWGDEFNGSKLDNNKWTTGEGSSHLIYWNKEQQYYSNKDSNLLLKNGTLSIIARREDYEGKADDGMEDNDSLFIEKKFAGFNKHIFKYTSGKINSTRLFTKGFFEIRFKSPVDKGLWPAFWLYGGYPNEEIDIFELKGERHSEIHVETHCANDCDKVRTWYGKSISWGGWLSLKGKLTTGFNVIAGEWGDNFVKIYVNGKCVGYSPVTFNVEKYLQANMAIPSNKGPFGPGPLQNFTKSTPFEIDYIRVWTKDVSGKTKRIRKSENKTTTSSIISAQGNVKGKTSNKFLYGKKANHANEGFFASLLPVDELDKNFVLYLSGLKSTESVLVSVKDEAGRNVFELKCGNFINKIDLSKLPSGSFLFTISYGGKTAETKIEL